MSVISLAQYHPCEWWCLKQTEGFIYLHSETELYIIKNKMFLILYLLTSILHIDR